MSKSRPPEDRFQGMQSLSPARRIKKLILSALVIVFLLCGCSPAKSPTKPEPPPPPPVKIRIAAVGDFLMHMPLITTSRDPRSGKYDFKDIFIECAPYLANPDFTLANLETRLAGPSRGYSGYPLFNAPAELAENMRELGFDLIATANNHSLDMGREGVITTLDNLDRAGLYHIGTYRSAEERNKPAVFEIKGIKVGFLNYTEHTNGIPVPPRADFLVNLIKRDLILKDIDRLKAEGTDFIIAYMHFGGEYQRSPDSFQRLMARELFEAGVDVVLGSHAHVLQPMEWHRVIREGKEKKALAAYSLGNFVSNQHWRYSDCGMILNLDIVKHHGEGAFLAEVSYIPVWVHQHKRDGKAKYRVLPIEKAIKDYETKSDPLITAQDYRLLKQAWEDTVSLMGPEFSPVL